MLVTFVGSGCSVKLPAEVVTPQVAEKVVSQEFWYAISGLVVGVITILAGVILLVTGVFAQSTMVAELLTFVDVRFNDAPVGLLLVVVGAWVIRFTRYRVEITNPPAPKREGTQLTKERKKDGKGPSDRS